MKRFPNSFPNLCLSLSEWREIKTPLVDFGNAKKIYWTEINFTLPEKCRNKKYAVYHNADKSQKLRRYKTFHNVGFFHHCDSGFSSLFI